MNDTTDLATDPSATVTCCGTGGTGMPADQAQALAHALAAVSDPVRLQVLSILAAAADGEVCACDFVGPIGRSQPTISHHLKVLAEAGLVTTERRGRWIWYRLVPGRLDDLAVDLTAVAAPPDA